MEREWGTSLPYANYFLALSRLIPKKNIGLIIDSYAEYRKMLQPDTEPWELVIVGEGPERNALQERIRHHNLDLSVHMVGRVDRFDDIVRYYTFCKALVLASNRSEPWGLVVNEAMAAGVPVLVSKQCGCSAELVNSGRNGFIFDGNSVQELADRILWLHKNERELAQMGKESIAIISEFSPDNFARKVRDLYRVASSRIGRGPLAPATSKE